MGIGKAIALELCKQGANLVLNGRNPERLEKTLQEFLQKGYPVVAVQGDVTKISDCNAVVQKAIDTFGALDILITNAGISMRERFENLKPEVFSQIIESNINGSAFPTHAALPHLK